MPLILVRHGQAGRKSHWNGDDALRPLDAKGRQQAQNLVTALGRYRHPLILSSPYVRCRQTVEPLGAARGLSIELTDALAPPAADQALDLVKQLIPAGPSTVIMCTHREVLVEILPALSSQFDVTLGHRTPGAKGSMWVLQFSKSRLTSVRYRAPKK